MDISDENEIENKNDLPNNLIYVGFCRKTMEVVDPESIKPEELVILTDGPNLFITGNNGGTLYGVYQWLKKYLGVDWILPGELGEVTPHTSTLSLGKINYRYQPPVQFRNLRSIPWGNERSVIPTQRILELAGVTSIEDSLKKSEEFFMSLPEPPFKKWGQAGGSLLNLAIHLMTIGKNMVKNILNFLPCNPTVAVFKIRSGNVYV